MKALTKIIATAVLVLSANMATANVEPKTSEDEVTKELKSLLGTPGVEFKNRELTATVFFIINKSNEIVVSDVEAENELVEYYIKSRLNYQKVETQKLVKGKSYKVSVTVKGE
ncbi:hypothetical protein SAMN04487906_0566 [Zhouia amylolytica]|uniref:Uncharacterized protein n=2 Tax=Zhouia amylolytica TaxID=376730 RepID=W2URG2_9FLAO|nr:hypothetical protein [Zhouia amylolytica]ETN96071.1 hypothetical protein P278_17930 [Zhouia amylolytica AD3]MCQ0111357.1 hypothetical protein [Zhouia amylolytica]SFS49842.1 hypothetical protein SAMN04487906_0566 [Zhouia amylolytica]